MRATDPASRADRLTRWLGEPVMGFFALLALALALAPVVLDLTPATERALDACQWAVVALFTLEYVVGLVRAPDRRAYAVSAWRLLDLVILVGPLVTLALPEWGLALATPALRLVRVLLFGVRIGGLAVRQVSRPTEAAARGPLVVSLLAEDGKPQRTSWEEVVRRLASPPRDEWLHASGLEAVHVAELAKDTGIAPAFLAQTLDRTAYPRVEAYRRFSALFTWIPALGADEDALVERNGVLLLVTEHGMLTIAQRALALQEDVLADAGEIAPPPGDFTCRTVLLFLKHVLRRYDAVAGELERHARALERMPPSEGGSAFLERSFRVQRQVAELKSDLWRLKGILEALADRRLTFHGLTTAEGSEAEEVHALSEYLRVLADEAGYVYETVFNAREALLSLIDLHINVVSFELNKVMRVLAVLSGLGLVPAIVGGLLGMNILGNPWPVSLAEVSFGVTTAMVLALYVFVVRGWLR